MNPSFKRLNFQFDTSAMRAESLAFLESQWIAHFNAQVHDGGWSGVALRATDGDNTTLYHDASKISSIADTPLMAKCPAIQSALEMFRCPLRSVRLLRLTAGSIIREHRDYDLGLDNGEARIHIPLQTNPLVEFYVANQRVIMDEGEAWYLDLSRPHRVKNAGTADRIHLVIDCVVNDWLLETIAHGDTPTRTAHTPTADERFCAFRQYVWSHPDLWVSLSANTEHAQFLQAVVSLGQQNGFQFSSEEVAAAMMRSRREWIEQWIM